MPILDFVAVSADLTTGAGELAQPRLSFRVRLAKRESLELATGEKFDDLEGVITLFSNMSQLPPGFGPAGRLVYFEAYDDDFHGVPASYIAEIPVTQSQFGELLAAARFGRVPSSILIESEGLEYGGAPDGSQKKWNNKTAHSLKLESANFRVPIRKLPHSVDSKNWTFLAGDVGPVLRQFKAGNCRLR